MLCQAVSVSSRPIFGKLINRAKELVDLGVKKRLKKKGYKDKKTFDFYIFYVVSLQRL